MKRRILVGLAAWLALCAAISQAVALEAVTRPLPRAEQAVQAPVDAIGRLASGMKGEASAVLVDVASGRVLEAYRGDVPMPPASVTKALTTLYAMDRLGPDYSFVTRLIATGHVVGGVIQGDLVLVGSGDPVLDSDELAGLIEQIRARGVTGVRGQFLYYDQALPFVREIDAGQPVEAAYNPAVAGLNLNFNRAHLSWEDEGQLAVTARAERYAPKAGGVEAVSSSRGGPVYMYEEKGGSDHWSIAASAIQKPGATWLPVRNPAPYAAEAFRAIARSFGINLTRGVAVGAIPAGTELARLDRRPLRLLARGMLHFSTNLTAEAIGLKASGAGGLATSGLAMQAWLEREYQTQNAKFRDHSGLGDANRIAADDMARVMAGAGRTGALDGLLRRYYVQDHTGKKPVAGGAEVRAKTGTLNFVRGLSGLIKVPGGRDLAFAIFSADLKARAAADGRQARPRGTRAFGNRAVGFEQAVLRRWILTYAQ